MSSEATQEQGGVLTLALLAILVGAWTGVVVALFRLALAKADHYRADVIAACQHWSFLGLALTASGCAAAAITAAWLPRQFSPYASGSGIPEVEVALTGQLPPLPLPRLLFIKFFGGLLAIGGGMALGPEGPSVQMGAVGARLIGVRFRRSWPDLHALIAAGTGAGLAVAFNAPIAGAVFVLEELVRRFESRTALAALGASSTAILVARLFLGDAPLFDVAMSAQAAANTGPLPYASAATWPVYLTLGAIAGLSAALYNSALIGALRLAEHLDRWPMRIQGATIGILIGVIGWFAPELIGGGENLTQAALGGAVAIGTIPLIFVIRFCLGSACYAVRAPGGLFAPLLLLGAQVGLMCGALCHSVFPSLEVDPQAFAVVGMAAFFTGVVRAPVTGIVLVIEMTAAFTTLLPMLAACFVAMVAANLVKSPPIYDYLRERLLKRVLPSS